MFICLFFSQIQWTKKEVNTTKIPKSSSACSYSFMYPQKIRILCNSIQFILCPQKWQFHVVCNILTELNSLPTSIKLLFLPIVLLKSKQKLKGLYKLGMKTAEAVPFTYLHAHIYCNGEWRLQWNEQSHLCFIF